MIHPGLVVLLVAVVVLIQVGVIVWVRRDIRGLETNMNSRMDEVVAALRQQADKSTAMVRRADDMLTAAGVIIDRFDEAAMMRGTDKTELERQMRERYKGEAE